MRTANFYKEFLTVEKLTTVYADNAATTAMSRTAIEAMLPYLDKIYGNPSSLHSVGQVAKEALEAARADIAACLGAQPNEIYFTSCGSESDNQAIRSAGAPRRAQRQKTHNFNRVRASRRASHA